MQLLIDTGFPRLSLVQKGKPVLPFDKDNSFAAVARRAVFSTFFFFVYYLFCLLLPGMRFVYSCFLQERQH